MTEQVTDTCTINGRLWSLDDWEGDFDVIPTNQQLGFDTVSRSTANWAGRIDHFLVFKNQLYLFKVEVELADKDKNLIPFGARREIRKIYEPVEVHDNDGVHYRENVYVQHYFIYDDLKIKFTGSLLLSFPYWDPWEYPWPLDSDDIEPSQEAEVVFVDGKVVGFDKWDI